MEALAEALAAVRADKDAAEAAAREAEGNAGKLAADLEEIQKGMTQRLTAAQAGLRADADTARAYAEQVCRERDEAFTQARETRSAADGEIARGRQGETDARAETQRVREDAAREREALRDSHVAQLEAQCALTDAERARAARAEAQLEAERADRRQLTTHIASGKSVGRASARRTETKTAPRRALAASSEPSR